MSRSWLRPAPDEFGPTWVGRLMDRLGLHDASCALGIGRESERQLKLYAIERELDAAAVAAGLLSELRHLDRGLAQRYVDRYGYVFARADRPKRLDVPGAYVRSDLKVDEVLRRVRVSE